MSNGTDGHPTHGTTPGGGGASRDEPDANAAVAASDEDRESLDGPSEDELPEDEVPDGA